MRRKFLALVLLVLLIISNSLVIGFAANSAEVYGDTIYTQENSIVFVPVYIKNNPGIMGFKITVKYDNDRLYSPSIDRGNVTENGMLNDSIGISPEGTFDIIWSNTDNVVTDGKLFIIQFKTSDPFEKSDIKLSFSQADTFNADFEDVKLNLNDISIIDSDETTNESASQQNGLASNESSINRDNIISAVEVAKEDFDTVSPYLVPEEKKEDFLSTVNSAVVQITGNEENKFDTYDEMASAYIYSIKEDYKESVLGAINAEDISSVVENSLELVGVKNFEDMDIEQETQFSTLVEEAFKKYAPDIKPVFETLGQEEYIKLIDEIYQGSKAEKNDGVKVKHPKQSENLICIILTVVVVIMVGLVALFCLIRRKKKWHS